LQDPLPTVRSLLCPEVRLPLPRKWFRRPQQIKLRAQANEGPESGELGQVRDRKDTANGKGKANAGMQSEEPALGRAT
jgi:hypothetical protein